MKKFYILSSLILPFVLGSCQQPNAQDGVADEFPDYEGIWTAPPTQTPNNKVPDGAINGNGDIGMVLGGTPEKQVFYFSKNDFWKAKKGYPDGGVCYVGELHLDSPTLQGASYQVEQSINDATIYSSYKKEDGIITFQLKGKELSRPLDDLDGLTERENEKRYVIYSNDDDFKKILTDRVKQDLLRFKIDKTLIDVIVSIRYEHVDIGIDYSDEFINIPVESEFKIEDLRKTKEDFKKVLQIIDDLSRN